MTEFILEIFTISSQSVWWNWVHYTEANDVFFYICQLPRNK